MKEHKVLTELNVPKFMQQLFPIIVFNDKKEIVFANERFFEITKYSKTDVFNKQLNAIHLTIIKENPKDFCLEGNALTVIPIEMEWKDKNESILLTNGIIIPYEDPIEAITYETIIVTSECERKVYDGKQYSLLYLRTLERAINETNAIIITNQNGEILSANKRYCELSKFSEEELIGNKPSVVKSGEQPREFYSSLWSTIKDGKIWNGNLKNRAKDGTYYWVNSTIVPINSKHGEPTKFINIQTEITKAILTEKTLQEALKNDFSKTVRNLQNIVFKIEKHKEKIVFTLLEGKLLTKFDWSLEKVSMETIREHLSPKDVKKVDINFSKALDNGLSTEFEIDYNEFTLIIYLSPIFDGDCVREVVGTIIDITNRKKAEILLQKMAKYDYLTQLPNRHYLQEKTEEILIEARKKNETFALLFIDIAHFKKINDSMGHNVGDEILTQFAERLKKITREEDFISRFGGDEFIVILPSVNEDETFQIVERFVEKFYEPFNYRNLEIFITPSIGISMFPRDGDDYETLVVSADIAMYHNKNKRNRPYQFFTKELKQNILQRTLTEIELRQAIDLDQLELVYQPIFELKSRKLIGVEALVRWNHPIKGYISPAEFIPIAEETGIIIDIGEWVVKEASRQMKRWHDEGFDIQSMAINISIAQFYHPLFVDFIEKALNEVGLDAKYINLEMTESMMLEKDIAEETFKRLEALGVSISIDDFGTGYSSLSYISDFPITHLKIDQTFIQNLTPSNKAIIKTIILLAKSLNMKVIAEGVEEENQEILLLELQCDEVQGYYYSRPVHHKEVEKLFRKISFN